MFGDYNLEDFFIFTKYKPCLTHSLLIIYIKMFKLMQSEVFIHFFDVDNHRRNVDSTRILRFQSIDVYCYK
jgi:hypothetical protein